LPKAIALMDCSCI